MYVDDIVVTGIGIVSPIGIGRQAFWQSLVQGRSGVRPIRRFDASGLPSRIAGEIPDFDPAKYVTKRKSLKVMCRDTQLGVAATVLACRDAGIVEGSNVDPQRLGVVLAADRICSDLADCRSSYEHSVTDHRFQMQRWAADAVGRSFPLMFLKVLPNMIASHVAIAHDARGPNNTIHQGETSALLAVGEAMRTIQRGAADVMIVGGASSQLHPFDIARHCVMGVLSRRHDNPAAVMRPFDARRDGQVWGEGAAAMILESRRHAEARGARIMARLLGFSSTGQPRTNGHSRNWTGLCRAIETAMEQSGMRREWLGHVNAHGLSSVHEDPVEARSLEAVVPGVPVFAPKSYFGNLGAASGAVELAASILSFDTGLVPATLNYDYPDPQCPVAAVRGSPIYASQATALSINWTWIGQASGGGAGRPGLSRRDADRFLDVTRLGNVLVRAPLGEQYEARDHDRAKCQDEHHQVRISLG